MAIKIAEYLGQRTDTELPIHPVAILPEAERNQSPLCPFDNMPCLKMRARRKPNHPVCSVRKLTGQYYIVCENRLISTTIGNMSQHQKDMLLMAGQQLFNPNIRPEQLGYKAEVSIRTREEGHGTHNADFILAVVDPNLETYGHRRILTEVQGGGETNNTGSITRNIEAWAASDDPNNQVLRQSVNAGTIETNAWRRLQEQLFAKATTAKMTGYGFAALLGDVVFDYMWRMIPGLESIRSRPNEPWDVAFVVYKERVLASGEPAISNVDLIVDQEKTFYTQLPRLFAQMALRGRRSPEAFDGSFITLTGELVNLEAENPSQERLL